MLAPEEITETLYIADNLEISYYPSSGIMYCNWIGFQERNLIQKCGAIILELTRQKSVSKVLNNNKFVTGSWWDAAVWAAEEWFPKMIEAGLKHFAWVLSPNIFAELSAKRAMEPYKEIVKTFYSLDEAHKWLLSPDQKA